MKVFVTVGTTSFDKLIITIDKPKIHQLLLKQGYKELVMQIGRGDYEPNSTDSELDVEYYKYKDSLETDIRTAQLAISHAGAGSCLEILGAGVPLLVVVNEELMNNHQIELAAKLAEDGHLFYCTCSTLESTLENMDVTKLVPFEKGQPQKFGAFMDNLFQVT